MKIAKSQILMFPVLLLVTLLILASTSLSAQTKPAPAKPRYIHVVQIPVEDYQTLTASLNDLKAAVIYNPQLSADQSRAIQRNIDAYLLELGKKVKLDSVKVGEGK